MIDGPGHAVAADRSVLPVCPHRRRVRDARARLRSGDPADDARAEDRETIPMVTRERAVSTDHDPTSPLPRRNAQRTQAMCGMSRLRVSSSYLRRRVSSRVQCGPGTRRALQSESGPGRRIGDTRRVVEIAGERAIAAWYESDSRARYPS